MPNTQHLSLAVWLLSEVKHHKEHETTFSQSKTEHHHAWSIRHQNSPRQDISESLRKDWSMRQRTTQKFVESGGMSTTMFHFLMPDFQFAYR